MGFLGTSSTLIPMELATTDESAGTITVSTDKETAKNGPAFDDDREITPEYENEVRSYYGLGAAQGLRLLRHLRGAPFRGNARRRRAEGAALRGGARGPAPASARPAR
jgi:hypothetical protein